jgi:hypothetical protein
MDSVLRDVHGFMRVSAENAIGTVMTGVGESSGGNLRGHAQPARVETVDQAGDGLALEIEFLQMQVERRSKAAEREAVYLEAVELVSVNRDVFEPSIVPDVLLVNTHADQVRHDIGEPVVVIAFDPDDFDVALGIRELANVSQKLPVIFGEAGEIEVGEDVTEQDQALEAGFLEYARGFARVARVCTEMQVGEDQRVVHERIHT